MENYIVINGKKVELTEEQLKALGIEVERKSIFRPKDYEYYYVITTDGKVDVNLCRKESDFYEALLSVGNCCTDKEVMQQRAYAETLNRLLWRYSMENGGDKIDWSDDDQDKWFLYYDVEGERWITEPCYSLRFAGYPLFVRNEVALCAIDEIIKPFIVEHPDFKP